MFLERCNDSNYGAAIPYAPNDDDAVEPTHGTFAILWHFHKEEANRSAIVGEFGLRKPVLVAVTHAALFDGNGSGIVCDLLIYEEHDMWSIKFPEYTSALELSADVEMDVWLVFSGAMYLDIDTQFVDEVQYFPTRIWPLTEDLCGLSEFWDDASSQDLAVPAFVCEGACDAFYFGRTPHLQTRTHIYMRLHTHSLPFSHSTRIAKINGFNGEGLSSLT